jgi:hypothetical protein
MKLKIPDLSNLFILLTILVAWYLTATVIQPMLHYQLQQTAFMTGIEFFRNFTAYPGGISDYLAEYLSQFFIFNSVGSLLIVAVASIQGIIALAIVKRLAGGTNYRYIIFAVILLFGVIVLCNYRYPYYASIRLLIAYIFTWGFCSLNSKYPRFSISFWLVFASLLFYLAGGPALFVYTLATGIIFMITNKQRIWLLSVPAFMIFAGVVPYLGFKYFFQITLRNIYHITMVKPPDSLIYNPEVQLYAYYLVLPIILLIVLFFLKFPKTEQNHKFKKGKDVGKVSLLKNVRFIVSSQVIIFSILAGLLFIKSYDPNNKNLISIEYYAEHEQWTEIQKIAKKINTYDFRINFHVNRAYSHLGQLPERMFSYPQLLGSRGLFIEPALMFGSSIMPTSDLYFDLGFMGESQRWAFEAQTLLPNSPRILKRLVMINLVNRKYNLAETFLTALNKNILCRDWVRKYEKYVSDTTLAAADLMIAEKRRFTPKKEIVNLGNLDRLKLLLETNKDNRMAYDYLITFCILDSQYDEFTDYLQDYTHYNLKSLPKSWEETLAFYILKNRTRPRYVTPETISKNCMQQISDFNTTLKSFNNNLAEAKSTLYQNFGDTYWYYMLYLRPEVTNILKNKTEVR